VGKLDLRKRSENGRAPDPGFSRRSLTDVCGERLAAASHGARSPLVKHRARNALVLDIIYQGSLQPYRKKADRVNSLKSPNVYFIDIPLLLRYKRKVRLLAAAIIPSQLRRV